jgi:hypothetical protein
MFFFLFGQACPLLISFWLFLCLWTSKMFYKPSLSALMVMKISLDGQFLFDCSFCLWNPKML